MQNISLGAISLYDALAFFFIYSFLGWIVEVAYHAVTMGKFVNRGFLNGPVCPIYGVGVTVIVLMLGEHIDKTWAVALVGLTFPTVIELVTGFALDKIFHNKWWDYSDRKFNLKGYICLQFSLLWCIAIVLVIEVVHPIVTKLAGLLGNVAGTAVVSVCIALMCADIVVTVLQALKLNRKLKEIDEAANAIRKGSDVLGKGVSAATVAAHDGIERAKSALSEKCESAIDAIVRKMPKRLLAAFPKLKSRDNPESVALAKDGIKRIKAYKKAAKKSASRKKKFDDSNK